MQSLENDLRNLLRELRILKNNSVSESPNGPSAIVYLLFKSNSFSSSATNIQNLPLTLRKNLRFNRRFQYFNFRELYQERKKSQKISISKNGSKKHILVLNQIQKIQKYLYQLVQIMFKLQCQTVIQKVPLRQNQIQKQKFDQSQNRGKNVRDHQRRKFQLLKKGHNLASRSKYNLDQRAE